MSKHWYVVHAYSGFENQVVKMLQERIQRSGMEDLFGEVLVPTEEVVEMRGGPRPATTWRRAISGHACQAAYFAGNDPQQQYCLDTLFL